MYKTASRNMQSRSFRSAQKAKPMRVRIGSRSKSKQRNGKPLRTEPALAKMLGPGPEFVTTVFRRYQRDFALLKYDPKRSSAFLNIVARVRMINGALWTDKAIESMFRRLLPEKK
jgi:hypothetical protein